jgi:hypothetical protein
MRRVFLAAVTAAIAMFSLAGLYTGVLARTFIASHVNQAMLRPAPNLGLVFAGYAVLALLMTLTYARWVRVTGSPAWVGVRFGLLCAIWWMMPYTLVLFGVYRFPYAVLPMDFVWALVEQGMGGLIIGLVLGNTAKSDSTRHGSHPSAARQ